MSDIFENGNFKKLLLITLEHNKEHTLLDKLQYCNIELKNIGNAYYARGIRGMWDFEVIDVKIYTHANKMSMFTDKDEFTIKNFSETLLPEKRVLGRIDIIPLLDDDISITLPQTTSQKLKALTDDINNAINRNEPSLVLDRLHTFSTTYLRELCMKNGIEIQDAKGMKHPLNSLVGSLKDYYKKDLSDFSFTAMKCFASLFEKYNKIRNDSSYAHDNNILSDTESIFVLQTVSAMLSFLDKVEINNKTSNKNTEDDLPF